jgi:hypothetical protein
MAALGTEIEDDLNLLDAKIKHLKLEYEQYFMGARKREPQVLRGEVQKIVNYYANVPIRNTGHRFKFNNLRSRFFAFRRHWEGTLRKIEDGRYEKHRFQAELHDRERRNANGGKRAAADAGSPGKQDVDQLFEAWVGAREATGQKTTGLTREKLQAQLEQQRSSLRERLGVADVRFRVVVEEGRAKLKASPVRK